MLLPPETRIHSEPDLTSTWRVLRGDLRFPALAVWVLRIDERGHPGPLQVLAGLPDGPYDVRADEVRALFEDLAAPSASIAYLYARPGSGRWHLDDRAWVRFLRNLTAGDRTWPVHRARDGVVEAA